MPRSILFFIFVSILLLGGCTEDEPPKALLLSHESLPEKNITNSSSRSLPEVFAEKGFFAKLQKPYELIFCYVFLDTINESILGNYFEKSLQDICQRRLARLFQPHFLPDKLSAQSIIKASKPEEVHRDFFSHVQDQEMVIAVVVYTQEQKISLKRLHLKTGRMSAILDVSFHSGQDIATQVADNFPFIVGLEGYLYDLENLQVVFRGEQESLLKTKCFPKESTFQIFRGKSLVAGVLVNTKKIYSQEGFLLAQAQILSKYSIHQEDRVSQIYFTGGKQTIQVLGANNDPMKGYSIFTSYQGFEDTQEHYRGTTDSSGEITIEDTQKKPLYVVVAKTVKGVNFTFTRQCIVVQSNSLPIEISVQNFSEVPNKEATIKELVEKAKEELRNKIEQARENIKKGELEKASLALDYAKEQLQKFPTKETQVLSQAYAKVYSTYNEAQKANVFHKKTLSSLKLQNEADQEMEALNYQTARSILLQANNLWTNDKNFDVPAYLDLQNRFKRVEVLLKEESESIGAVRKYLAKKIETLNKENTSKNKIMELQENINLMGERGELREEVIYNDRFLLLQSSIVLDKLSENLAKEANFYLSQYRDAQSAEERRKIYKKHEHFYQCSKMMDDVLKVLAKLLL